MIYGARIKQVRELRGWTQQKLADILKVTQSFVAQVEKEWSQAPEDFVTTLVFRSGFQKSFFERPPNDGMPYGSLLFRAHSQMSDRGKRAVHRHAEMAYDLVRQMVSNPAVKEVAVRVPNCHGYNPEQAAMVARSECGLAPDAPVKHMISILENAGVLVMALPVPFENGDAFSAWAIDGNRRRPIVVLSANRPADRLRMNAAHELGHLVMHSPASGTPKKMEDEAKAFASAFLLPPDAMHAHIMLPLTLDDFVPMKLNWGVSIAGLIARAHALGIITPRKYRTLFQKLGARGWKHHEPLSHRVPLERPRAVRQIAELLYGGRRIDYTRMAADTGYPGWFVKELIDVHAATGAKTTTEPEPPLRDSGRRLDFNRRG